MPLMCVLHLVRTNNFISPEFEILNLGPETGITIAVASWQQPWPCGGDQGALVLASKQQDYPYICLAHNMHEQAGRHVRLAHIASPVMKSDWPEC